MYREVLEEDRVDKCEDRRIGTNPERQRDHRDGGEYGFVDEESDTVKKVLAENGQNTDLRTSRSRRRSI